MLDNPEIARFANGNYLVSYERDFSSADHDVYYAVVNPQLDALISGPTFFSTAASFQGNARVATFGNFGLIVLQDDGNSAGVDIRFRLVDQTGASLDTGTAAGAANSDNLTFPDVAELTDGRFVIVWQDDTSTNIAGRFYDPVSHTLSASTFPISTGASLQFNVHAAGLQDGGFLATWDDVSGMFGDSSTAVHGQRFDSNGNPSSPEFRVNTTAASSQFDNAVATNAFGDALVVWQDNAAANPFSGDTVPMRIEGQFLLPPPNNDVNGDLTSDLVLRQDTGFVGEWLLQNGLITAGVTIGFAAGGDHEAGLGDFNGDGTADILWRNDSGFLGQWQMKAGHINAGISIGFAAGGDHVAGIGDFDGDNTSDILFRNDSGFVGEWLMQNGHILGGFAVGFAAAGDHVAGIGEFSGGVTSDILWRNDNGFVGIWQMQDGHINAGVQVGFAAAGDHIAGVGDFNGDRTSDILWRNDSGQIGMWLMQGGHINAGLNVAFVDNTWHIADVADYNADSKADILFRNDSGQIGIWLMDGNVIAAAPSPGSLPSDWHIIG